MTATKTVEAPISFAGVFDTDEVTDTSDMVITQSPYSGNYVIRQEGKEFSYISVEYPNVEKLAELKNHWAQLDENKRSYPYIEKIFVDTGRAYDSWDPKPGDDGGRYGGGYADYTVWK